MALSDEDLLGASNPMAQFSQARAPPRGLGGARMQRQAPARLPAATSAKSVAASNLWCFMLLAFLAFSSYGIWSVPSHDRSLANFESKLRFVERAFGGELEKENSGLTVALRGEKQKEVELRQGEDALRKQLKEAHQEEEVMQKKTVSTQQDIVKARDSIQNWHRKSDDLRSQLGLVKKSADQKQKDLQRAHKETSQAQERAHESGKQLAAARKQTAGLQASERQLRGQLQHEQHWHQATIQKFHRFKDAEETFIKSIDIENGADMKRKH